MSLSDSATRKSGIKGINVEPDGMCRTIKAVYYKTSVANLLYRNDWGATGAMLIYEK